ncbi:MAG: hypothetical protein IJ740_01080 [Ruminococcus sp.]|nr:hypothetical protein [Ruminococcus sp.]
MKKFLAAALALTMTAAMFTACGDSDSSSSSTADATTTTAAESSAAEEESSAAEGDASSEEEAAEPVDISECTKELKNYDTASVKFTMDTDPALLVGDMAEQDTTPDEDDRYPNDESRCSYEMEEVAGVPMIKVTVRDLKDEEDPELGYKIPKIRFKMNEIFEGIEDKLPTVFTIKADVIYRAVGDFTPDDGGDPMHVPGNFMGGIAVQCITDTSKPENLSWTDSVAGEVATSEWVSEWGYCELTANDIPVWQAFAESTEPQYFTFMRWSIPNDACFYIADLTFLDEDGNVIAIDKTFDKK